ncbi:vacuolar protein sorting-associated protein 4-like [Saccoglossus kowalevskii]|uniref:Vacuolar protein sorting-associated protein 4-like n=1 Tax=Saccoglossus kowalevskii TaxID=10224 RepID=A0ABM0GWZ3_SACKO|nr:PREDICTED: vacuolar protein sorting-associated protein 4-like [Saccoglossus kowalevskii]
MSVDQQYEEASVWLAAAAEECRKTHNVDIEMLIRNCENCARMIEGIQQIEKNPVRKKALDELSIAICNHLTVLKAKKEQLDDCMLDSSVSSQSSTSDAGSKSKDSAADSDQKSKLRCAIADTIVQKGHIKFDDVAGLVEAKQTLKEAIIMPVQYPHLFTGGRKPWKRILLYGPPGTGKSRLAQAVSSEIDSVFYCVSSSDLVSSWVGESEKLIKELFQHAVDQKGRSVVFIDEIDSICRKRSCREEEHTRRIKTELMKQMEGADNTDSADNLFLLCATNCPWELDTAFLRRFQKRIYVPLPDREARISLMKIHAVSNNIETLADADWDLLADETDGHSGSDIATLTLAALFQPIRDMQHATHWICTADDRYTPCSASVPGAVKKTMQELPPDKVQPRDVVVDDFITSLQTNRSTVTKDELERFAEFTKSFGQNG